MYRRVRKAKAGNEVVGSLDEARNLLSTPRATLADLGFRISPDGAVDAIVDAKGAPAAPAAYSTVDEEKEKALARHWEEVLYASTAVLQETLTAPLPAPTLVKPVIADLEASKHWSQQHHADGLRRGYGLQHVHLPRESGPSDMHTTLLASPNWQDASRLVVLVPNGDSPLGIWSRALTLQGPMAKGSMLDAVHQILLAFGGKAGHETVSWNKCDTAVLIANPGERYWAPATEQRPGRAVTSEYAQFRLAFKVIPGLESIEAHLAMLFHDYVLPSKAIKIHLLATAASTGALVSCLATHFEALKERVCSVGLLQPQHHVNQLAVFGDWFRHRALAIAMRKDEHDNSSGRLQLISKADRETANASNDDEPLPEISKGCLVLASAASKFDLLPLRGVPRLVSFMKFRDSGGDLAPLLKTYAQLEEASLHAQEVIAAVEKGGLQGWG